MLRKLHGRPRWYQTWAVLVGLAAIYVLVRVFAPGGLGRLDYAIVVFVHVSLLLDYVVFPRAKGEGATSA